MTKIFYKRKRKMNKNLVDLGICRVCLQDLDIDKLGTKSLQNLKVRAKFNAASGIQITGNDGLPQHICDRCYMRLNIAYGFRKEANSSYTRLVDYVNRICNNINEVATSHNNALNSNQIIELEGHISYEDLVSNYDEEEVSISSQSNVIVIDSSLNENVDNQEGFVKELPNNSNYISTKNEAGEEYYENFEMLENQTDVNLQDVSQDASQDVSQDFPHVTRQEVAQEKMSSLSQNFVLKEITIDPLNPAKSSVYKKEKTKSVKYNMLNSHTCLKCNKVFSTSSNLQRHSMSHEGIKPYKCELCDKKFTQNGSLKKHMLLHTGEKPHICDICGRGFTQSTTLQFHMRRHTGEKPFPCPQCDRAFRIRDALKRHIALSHHSVGQILHICSKCNRQFSNKNSLNTHMLKHEKIEKKILGVKEQFECQRCHKILKSKSSYAVHLKRHGEYRTFLCGQCSKSFSNKVQLNLHLKTHVKVEKPFKCDSCDKSFINETLLKDHKDFLHKTTTLILKLNDDVHTCQICSKTYRFRENMIQHLKTHSEDLVTYNCIDCGIEFGNLIRYKVHRFNKHGEAFENSNLLCNCYECESSFFTIQELIYHLEEVHDRVDELCTLCNKLFVSKKEYNIHVLEHGINSD